MFAAAASSKFKIPVNIEIEIRAESSVSCQDVTAAVRTEIEQKVSLFQNGPLAFDEMKQSKGDMTHEANILTEIQSITVTDLPPGRAISFWQAELCLHAYRLSEQQPDCDYLDGEEELAAAEQWELPNIYLRNLWESVIIDPAIKNRLLSYCSTSIQFSDSRIDPDIISWNRMALLHGPPGTGKTTICKALAQKTFIRNAGRYSSGVLMEVNSHSLFSKWFSESGKLVMKLFSHISEIAEDEECMVVVLIDEVESITTARSASAGSNEPGDAVRAVNAVLTSLDSLKRRPNVLVLCTSNMIEMVDAAFLDRVDVKAYLGPPDFSARYSIIRSCILELVNKKLIQPAESIAEDWQASRDQLLSVIGPSHVNLAEPSVVDSSSGRNQAKTYELSILVENVLAPSKGSLDFFSSRSGVGSDDGRSCQRDIHKGTATELGLTTGQYLCVITTLAQGMSGRSLRKLPVKAHSYYIQRPSSTLMEFLSAMHLTILSERDGKRSD